MDFKQRFHHLATKSLITESSAFKNIVALNDHDISFLRNMGIYACESFKSDIKESIRRAKYESSLFEQLRKESVNYLKGTTSVFWNQKEYTEGDDPVGVHAVSVSKDYMLETKGTVLTKYFDENRVLMYLPILEDWADYYIRTCKEGLGRKLILNSVLIPLRNQRTRRICVYESGKEEMVDILRE